MTFRSIRTAVSLFENSVADHCIQKDLKRGEAIYLKHENLTSNILKPQDIGLKPSHRAGHFSTKS